MKTIAAVLREMGKSSPYGDSKPLAVEEVELEGPGPGELLIEVAGAGLCHSDLSVIDGSRPRVMPMALGHEASGVVRETGAEVRDFKDGDHVVLSFVPSCGRCVPCAEGRPALCEHGAKANAAGTLLRGARRLRTQAGGTLHHHLGVSAFSRFTVVAQESAILIPEDAPLEEAALFGCAVMTGVGAVFNTARVEPGSSVAVFGLGGVGLSAVMGAKAAGAWPIVAVDLLESKLALALRLGASHVVCAAKEDAVEAIRQASSGGVAYAFEAAGSEKALSQAYAATRRGGKTVTMGLPHPAREFRVPAFSLAAEERVVLGSYMGSSVPRRDIPRYIAMHRAGLLPVDLLRSRDIALADINSAFDELSRGEAVRQIIRFN